LGVDAGTCVQVTIKDVSKLKQRLIEAWSAMQQRVIDEAIDWHACTYVSTGWGKKSRTYMLYIAICLILVLSLEITEVGATKTKQLIFFAILLMLK